MIYLCASGSVDFMLLTSEVVIPSTTAQDQSVCVAAVVIFGDDIVEGNEMFQLMIQPTNTLDMVLADRSTVNVTIVDDDGKHKLLNYNYCSTNLNNSMSCPFATHRSNCFPQWDQHRCSGGSWGQHNCLHLCCFRRCYGSSTTGHCGWPNCDAWQCQR